MNFLLRSVSETLTKYIILCLKTKRIKLAMTSQKNLSPLEVFEGCLGLSLHQCSNTPGAACAQCSALMCSSSHQPGTAQPPRAAQPQQCPTARLNRPWCITARNNGLPIIKNLWEKEKLGQTAFIGIGGQETPWWKASKGNQKTHRYKDHLQDWSNKILLVNSVLYLIEKFLIPLPKNTLSSIPISFKHEIYIFPWLCLS